MAGRRKVGRSPRIDMTYFPYPPRAHQRGFIEFVQNEVKMRHVVINAPTGFGKTPLILAALLPLAISEGRRIIWAVRTGNETDRPIEELKTIVKGSTADPRFGLSLRGKKDMCLLLRELELKGEVDHGAASYICKKSRENCRYNLNLESESYETYTLEPKLYSEILSLCDEREVCPYYLQFGLIPNAEILALSYNYIVNPDVRWALRKYLSFRESYLVVDEAHNLQGACSSINSDRITLRTIRKALRELEGFGVKIDADLKRLLEDMRKYFEELLHDLDEDVEFNLTGCIRHCSRSLEGFVRNLKKLGRYGLLVRGKMLDRGEVPRSSLHHLSTFWSNALQLLGTNGIAFIASKEREGGGMNLAVEIWDMRASVILKDVWSNFHRCIFCSGTLKPLDSFAEVVGLSDYRGAEYPSTFPRENSVALIVNQLTTQGEELSSDMAQKYIQYIGSFASSLNENIAVFSASYRIQESLRENGLLPVLRDLGRKVFVEEQGMRGDRSRMILEDFKAASYSRPKAVLLATATGRFAEGADFPGGELAGIFLTGVPFDRMNVRTRLYLDYYRRIHGDGKGRFYGYILPAIRRASQALGRALRSEEDRAIFILGDRRYKRFLRLLPDFVSRNRRMVSTVEDLSSNIKKFWQHN